MTTEQLMPVTSNVVVCLLRRGHSPGPRLRIRLRNRVPSASSVGVLVQAARRRGGHVPEKGARASDKVSKLVGATSISQRAHSDLISCVKVNHMTSPWNENDQRF